MKNPWTGSKNPWMSLWLSGFHAAAGTARSRAAAEARRQTNALMHRSLEQAADFWSAGLMAPPGAKRRKRR